MTVYWIRTCVAFLVGGGGVGRVALVDVVLGDGDMGEDGDEEVPIQATTATQMAKFRRPLQWNYRPSTAHGHMMVSRSRSAVKRSALRDRIKPKGPMAIAAVCVVGSSHEDEDLEGVGSRPALEPQPHVRPMHQRQCHPARGS